MKKTIVASVLALSALAVFTNPAKACFWCDPIKGISDAIDDPGKAIENLGEAIIDVPKKVFDPDNWSKAPGPGDPLFPNQNENIGGQSGGFYGGQSPPKDSSIGGLDDFEKEFGPDEEVAIPQQCPECDSYAEPGRSEGWSPPDLPEDFLGPTYPEGELANPMQKFNNPSPNRSGFNSPDCPMIQGVKVCHY